MGSFGSQNAHSSQSSNSAINPAFMPYATAALDRAQKAGNQGYTPYMGMDVAIPDSLVNSWQQTADRNASFNTPGHAAQDVRSSLPLTTQNGIQGLSSFSGYQDQLAQLQKNYPGMYDYIKSFAIDPVTGKPGDNVMKPGDPAKRPGGPGNMMAGQQQYQQPQAAWYYTANRDFIAPNYLANNYFGTSSANAHY